MTRADGSRAIRTLRVSLDESSYSDVIQRTEDGFTRDSVRTAADGRTHTRAVEVACDEDARRRVKQVEVGQKP